MIKKLHIKVPNFIKDPYVVRLDFGHEPDIISFRKYLKSCKNNTATWGYSDPEIEALHSNDPIPFAVNGKLVNISFPSHVYRSYWVFSDDVDALQFRLSAGEIAKQIYMWPNNVKFTITEFLEEEHVNK